MCEAGCTVFGVQDKPCTRYFNIYTKPKIDKSRLVGAFLCGPVTPAFLAPNKSPAKSRVFPKLPRRARLSP
jgi:hypothetical protein